MENVSTHQDQLTTDRHELALEAAGIGIWDNDLLTDTISFSGYSYQIFDIPKGSTLTLQTLLSRLHPADRERVREQLKSCFDPTVKATYETEYRITDPHFGEVIRWVRSKGKAYFSEVGIPYRFTGVVQDITSEVKAREKQQKLLALVDNSIELMSVLENDQTNSYINKAGMEMLGFDNMEQVRSTPISQLHTPEDIEFVQANVLPSVINTGKWSGVMNVRHLKTGEVFPVYNNTVRIHDSVTGEPIAVGAVMRDMRPEMAAQKALEESEKNFRTLVMQAPVGICILKGDDFVVEIVNDSFIEVAWKKREEMLGKKVTDVFPEATQHGFDKMLQAVYATGQPFYGKEMEVVQERGNETKIIYVDFTFQPLIEPNGSINRIINLSIDVTDKVLARKQLQKNEEELQKRVTERTAELEKKNRELEEFTYISSHDLQEPIRKMKMFREMIRERDFDKLSDFSKEKFNKVGESLERMSNSLKDLLAFASLNKEEESTPVDLNAILQDVESDLELMIEQKAAVISKDVLPVMAGVQRQMHQLFYNLLNNALKFSKKEEAPHIEVRVRELSTEEKNGWSLIDPSKEYYEFVVKDNGIGFEQEKADKIFGMFQRLHARNDYPGTGIGLALCRKVVNNHGGIIYTASQPGKGASFYMILPK